MRATFQTFGERRGLGQFAPLVYSLYNNALATSSKKTYRRYSDETLYVYNMVQQICFKKNIFLNMIK